MATTKTTIPFEIDDDELPRIEAAMKGLYPIPETEDGKGETIPDFTDAEWVKEAVRRVWLRDIERWERKQAQSVIVVSVDDSIIT